MDSTNPLISVVTVSYNAADTLEKTILSVINQDFENYEYIIVDGGSKDGTIDIIKKYQEKITLWVSEPDKGIYDAMNKGAKLAKGQWVNYMNSGDSFFDLNVLKTIAFVDLSRYDVVYGAINCVRKNNSFISRPKSIKKINSFMVFNHQSSFVRRDLVVKYIFDINLKIAADFKFFRTLYNQDYKFKEINSVIVNYDVVYGVSSVNPFKLLKEYAIIKGTWDSPYSRVLIYLRSILIILLKNPRNMINKYLKK